jgi:hypothetical protein
LKYHQIDLKPYMNNVGFTYSDKVDVGALTMANSSLPKEEMIFNETFEYKGIPFIFEEIDERDNLELEEQTVHFSPVLSSKLHFIGVSIYGDYYDDISCWGQHKHVYSGKLGFPDFLSEQEDANRQKAFAFSKLHGQLIHNDKLKPSIWYSSIEFNEPLMMDAIKFEDNPFIHLFALTIQEAGTGE